VAAGVGCGTLGAGVGAPVVPVPVGEAVGAAVSDGVGVAEGSGAIDPVPVGVCAGLFGAFFVVCTGVRGASVGLLVLTGVGAVGTVGAGGSIR
jgi:hypothetical protein